MFILHVFTTLPDGGVDRRTAPELEESNYIEPDPEPVSEDPEPRAQSPDPPSTYSQETNPVVSTEQMSKEDFLWQQISQRKSQLHQDGPGLIK